MKAITIDQLGIETHERYAKDQEVLDETFIQEAAPHWEILSTSSLYSSQWEKLFECNQRNHPWAAFAAPPRFFPLSRHGFFDRTLVPNIGKMQKDKDDQEHQEEDEETEKMRFFEEKERLMNVQIAHPSLATLEKERSILFTLFGSMEELNDLLREINSRKLQYQKG